MSQNQKVTESTNSLLVRMSKERQSTNSQGGGVEGEVMQMLWQAFVTLIRDCTNSVMVDPTIALHDEEVIVTLYHIQSDTFLVLL